VKTTNIKMYMQIMYNFFKQRIVYIAQYITAALNRMFHVTYYS